MSRYRTAFNKINNCALKFWMPKNVILGYIHTVSSLYVTKEISFISAYAWGHSNFQLRKCFLTQNSKMMKSLFQAHDIRETDISMMQNPAYSCSISLNFIYSRYFTLLTLEVNACWNCLGNRFKVCRETILEFYIHTKIGLDKNFRQTDVIFLSFARD